MFTSTSSNSHAEQARRSAPLLEAALSGLATMLAAGLAAALVRWSGGSIDIGFAVSIAVACWVGGLAGGLIAMLAPGLAPAYRYLIGMIARMGAPLLLLAALAVSTGRPAFGVVVVLLAAYLAGQACEVVFCVRQVSLSAAEKKIASPRIV